MLSAPGSAAQVACPALPWLAGPRLTQHTFRDTSHFIIILTLVRLMCTPGIRHGRKSNAPIHASACCKHPTRFSTAASERLQRAPSRSRRIASSCVCCRLRQAPILPVRYHTCPPARARMHALTYIRVHTIWTALHACIRVTTHAMCLRFLSFMQ